MLFAADGIRQRMGVPPFTREAMGILGCAVGMWLRDRSSSSVVLLASDTRHSCQKIKDSLIENLNHMGVGTVDADILPTAGLSFNLIDTGFFHAGIMITASHNPVDENGVKIFDQNGEKIDRDSEQVVEYFYTHPKHVATYGPRARNVVDTRYARAYAEEIASEFNDLDWRKIRITFDCANGAVSEIAPRVLQTLGLPARFQNNWPDGTNINFSGGSEYIRSAPERMAANLRSSGSQVGVALDGDGDRAVIVDNQGRFYDGDDLLAILGLRLQNQKRLQKQAVVTTRMSNSGLTEYLGHFEINVRTVQNGDKYITRELVTNQLTLGGEQIGHIIVHDRPQRITGDGLRTALLVLSEMTRQPGLRLSDMAPHFQKWPQVIASVCLNERTSLQKEEIPGLVDSLAEVTFRFPDVRVRECRPASTEPAYRLMLEAPFTPVRQLAKLCREVARPILRCFGVNECQVRVFDCLGGGELDPE